MNDLEDLIGKLKEKRSKQEFELKKHGNPAKCEFYAIMARLGIYDWLIPELEHIEKGS